MTTRFSSSRTPDGALVRLIVRGETWAEGVPPVPDGSDITVTFTDGDAALVHGDALGLLGYRVLGVQAHRRAAGTVCADFLVPQAVLEVHTTWWRALTGLADRAFSLACGPVRASLAGVLRAHLEPLLETAVASGAALERPGDRDLSAGLPASRP